MKTDELNTLRLRGLCEIFQSWSFGQLCALSPRKAGTGFMRTATQATLILLEL